MIFKFSSVKVFGEITHIGASLHNAYLNIFLFFSEHNRRKHNSPCTLPTFLHMHTAGPVFLFFSKQRENMINEVGAYLNKFGFYQYHELSYTIYNSRN